MNSEYGSQWRRWDLHLHTPETNKNDQYNGSTIDEKWDNFYNAINDYVGDETNTEKNIAVVGITDYLSIDNYLKVRKNKDKLPKSIMNIFPNVELRLNIKSKKSQVNIHCVFDSDIVDNLNDDFFAKLKFDDGEKEYIATRTSLIKLGKSMDNSIQDEEKAYKEGVDKFVVTLENLREIFSKNSKLREHTLIVVANSDKDGASGVDNNGNSQMKGIAKNIYRFADAIFSGNSNDVEFFLGKKDSQSFKDNFGSIKPCIHGSDAHVLEKIFEPDLKRYCWIKADPTFEGLKQILYEPEDRVYIGEHKPDNKNDHQVIKSIEFEDPKFSKNKVVFNDNLTCIIGGKSTGKSLLLHEVAKNIDSEYCISQENVDKKTKNDFGSQKAKVTWKDETTVSRKIIFVPQTYLNRIVDDPEKNTDVDKMIELVLMQNEEISKAFDNMNSNKKEMERNNKESIFKLEQLYIEENTVSMEIKEIGNSKIYNSKIKELEEKKKALSEKLNVDEKDLKNFDDINKSRIYLLNKLKSYKEEKEELDELLLKDAVINIAGFTDADNNDIESKFPLSHKLMLKTKEDLEKKVGEKWKNHIDKIVIKINKIIKDNDDKITELNPKYEELKNIVEKNNELKEIACAIENEKNKYEESLVLENKKDEIKAKISKILEELFSATKSYEEINEEFCNSIRENNQNEKSKLKFDVEYVWKKEDFTNWIKSTFDNRKMSSFREKYNFDLMELSNKDYGSQLIRNIWDAVKDETLHKKGSNDNKDIIGNLTKDWYNVHYIIESDNDKLDAMSPGKKALVLLEILINLDNSLCPILIDQPEDDLDNRSIYNDLVQYLKSKKKERQIIIVSHNANVVIGSDAEEIIIANQNGIDCQNEDGIRFDYRSGSIENNKVKCDENGTSLKGFLNERCFRNQVCDILEGGKEAFEKRYSKYITSAD